MANNPFPIDIDEADYFNRQAKEQRWILYCAVRAIHTQGCMWARRRWRRLVILALLLGSICGLLGGAAAEAGVVTKLLIIVFGG